MKSLVNSRFLIPTLAVLGFLILTTFFVDRTKYESVTIIGDLSDAQLFSVKNGLRELEADLTKNSIRKALIDLDWIHRTNVRRRWPSGFSIEVLPESVVAYWNVNGFINPSGEILVTDLLDGGDLPGLYGPEGTEQEVMAQFQELGGILARHDLEIKNLRRSELGSWTIETRNRITVLLGKEDLRPRIERFLVVNSLIKKTGEEKRVRRMDARYINGVAVRFEDKLNLSIVFDDALTDINESLEVRSL